MLSWRNNEQAKIGRAFFLIFIQLKIFNGLSTLHHAWAFFDFCLSRVDPVPALILNRANTATPMFSRITSQRSQMALLVNISSSVSVSDSEGLRNHLQHTIFPHRWAGQKYIMILEMEQQTQSYDPKHSREGFFFVGCLQKFCKKLYERKAYLKLQCVGCLLK